jgi:hypothetical protein
MTSVCSDSRWLCLVSPGSGLRFDTQQLISQRAKLRKTNRGDLDGELATSVNARGSNDSVKQVLLEALFRIKKSSGPDEDDGEENSDEEQEFLD